jgi:hypothetical protein
MIPNKMKLIDKAEPGVKRPRRPPHTPPPYIKCRSRSSFCLANYKNGKSQSLVKFSPDRKNGRQIFAGWFSRWKYCVYRKNWFTAIIEEELFLIKWKCMSESMTSRKSPFVVSYRLLAIIFFPRVCCIQVFRHLQFYLLKGTIAWDFLCKVFSLTVPWSSFKYRFEFAEICDL